MALVLWYWLLRRRHPRHRRQHGRAWRTWAWFAVAYSVVAVVIIHDGALRTVTGVLGGLMLGLLWWGRRWHTG